jgi:hypothetical protein
VTLPSPRGVGLAGSTPKSSEPPRGAFFFDMKGGGLPSNGRLISALALWSSLDVAFAMPPFDHFASPEISSPVDGDVEDPLSEFGKIIELHGEFAGPLVVAAKGDVVFVFSLNGKGDLVVGAAAHVGSDDLNPQL